MAGKAVDTVTGGALSKAVSAYESHKATLNTDIEAMNGVIDEQTKLSQTLKASADSIKKIENAKDLTDKLTELSEALTELEAATNAESDLQTGAAAVADGVATYVGGAKALNTGLTALDEGSRSAEQQFRYARGRNEESD